MRKLILVSCLFFCCAGFAQNPADDPTWQVILHDDFLEPQVNTNIWAYHPGWGNCSDSSTLTSDGHNHIISSGVLRLATFEETSPCFNWNNDISPDTSIKSYTSGAIFSNNSYKYGYFEIRSRFPVGNKTANGKGLSPTFWLFTTFGNHDTGYVKFSEIDIYEIMYADTIKVTEMVNRRLRTRIDTVYNVLTSNIHYADSDHYTLLDGRYYSYWKLNERKFIPKKRHYNDGLFHTYAAQWDSVSIRFFIDGELVRTFYDPDDILFQPYKLLPMNVIVANSANSSNFKVKVDSITTIMPYYYDVDYVRVYHLLCDQDEVVNEIIDFNNYYYAVKKSITMGGATTLPQNSTTYLHAVDFIELKPGFEVSGSSAMELYIDSKCSTQAIYNYQ